MNTNSATIAKHDLLKWLNESVSAASNGRYIHRLLKEQNIERSNMVKRLRKYTTIAHSDAKSHLLRCFDGSLSPFKSAADNPCNRYPSGLNITTLQGYLGEVMASVFAETLGVHGKTWSVPAFLFRFHRAAFQYLEMTNARLRDSRTIADPDNASENIPGRTGDDALAFEVDKSGSVVAVLVCEAKCLSKNNTTTVADAHTKLSGAGVVTASVLEIIEVLRDRKDPDSVRWYNALIRFRSGGSSNARRYDMLSYICGSPPATAAAWISTTAPHDNYTGKRSLEVLEAHIDKPRELAELVYR